MTQPKRSWDEFFCAEDFESHEMDVLGATCKISGKPYADKANAILREELEKMPTILMNETYWSFEGDEAFRPRAKWRMRVFSKEEIKG